MNLKQFIRCLVVIRGQSAKTGDLRPPFINPGFYLQKGNGRFLFLTKPIYLESDVMAFISASICLRVLFVLSTTPLLLLSFKGPLTQWVLNPSHMCSAATQSSMACLVASTMHRMQILTLRGLREAHSHTHSLGVQKQLCRWGLYKGGKQVPTFLRSICVVCMKPQLKHETERKTYETVILQLIGYVQIIKYRLFWDVCKATWWTETKFFFRSSFWQM